MSRITAILLLLALAAPAPLLACTALPPELWFTPALAIDDRQLPPGVAVQPSNSAEGGIMIEIYNSTATPLYVLIPLASQTGSLEEIPASLLDGASPLYKIVSSQAFVWTGTCPTCDPTWTPFSAYAPDHIVITPPGLADLNIRADDRPADATPPAPQTSQLLMVYGENLIAAPATLTYALNPAYVADTQRKSAKDCENFMRYGALGPVAGPIISALPLVFGLGLVGALAFYVIRRLKRRQQASHGE
jgi:hypothetical protein